VWHDFSAATPFEQKEFDDGSRFLCDIHCQFSMPPNRRRFNSSFHFLAQESLQFTDHSSLDLIYDRPRPNGVL
jgi:hypothetical protein